MFLLRTHHWNPVYIIALIKISGVVCTIIKVACYSTLWLSLQRGVYSILRMHPTTWCDNEKTFGMQRLSIITKRMTFESCLSPFSFPHPLEIEHMLLSLPHRGSSWPYLNCPFHSYSFSVHFHSSDIFSLQSCSSPQKENRKQMYTSILSPFLQDNVTIIPYLLLLLLPLFLKFLLSSMSSDLSCLILERQQYIGRPDRIKKVYSWEEWFLSYKFSRKIQLLDIGWFLFCLKMCFVGE